MATMTGRQGHSPELSIALRRITAGIKSDRLLMVVLDDLIHSLQARQTAASCAHERWMQLEQLGADVIGAPALESATALGLGGCGCIAWSPRGRLRRRSATQSPQRSLGPFRPSVPKTDRTPHLA